MTVACETQPYCRCCGKPIPKVSVLHLFGRDKRVPHNQVPTYHEEWPFDTKDVRRITGGVVSKVERWDDRIISAYIWDGVSYRDDTFCTLRCGDAFGRMAAREFPNLETTAGLSARLKREAKARG